MQAPGPGSSTLVDGQVVAAEVEAIVDLVIGRKEALAVASRLVPLHCGTRHRVGWYEML